MPDRRHLADTRSDTLATAGFKVDALGRMACFGAIITDHGLLIGYTHPGSGSSLYGVTSDPTLPATTTVLGVMYRGEVRTVAFAFTLAEGDVFLAFAPNRGAGSTVTDLSGFRARNQGATGITNAHGLFIEAQSGAATLNIAARLAGGSTANLWLDSDAASIAGGIAFGASRDTSLFRAAAGILQAQKLRTTNGLQLTEQAAPATPGAGLAELYVKTSGRPYLKDDAGTELPLDSSKRVPLLVSRLVAFGHSYLTAGLVSHPDRQYITLLSGMTRSDLIDLAIGGAQAANDNQWMNNALGVGGWATVLQQFTPVGTTAPYGPEGNLPLLHFGQNDLNQHAHDATGNPRTIFKTAMRTMMSRLVASRVFEESDASVVFSGSNTWKIALATTLRNSGAGYRPVRANTATFTITLPSDFEGGVVAVGLIVFPLSDGQITWSGTAFVAGGGNGTNPGTTTLSGLAYAANGVAGSRRDSSNGHVVRIAGLTAADAGRTIIGTYASGAGTTFAAAPTVTGVTKTGTGTTTYGYKRVYRTYNGDTVPGGEGTITLQNATLSGAAFNNIPAGAAWPAGVEAEFIYRSTGGANNGGQGVIAVLTSGPAAVVDTGQTPTAYLGESQSPLTGGFAFDYWQIEATNPITRGVVVKLNRILTYQNSGSDTDVANYNSDIDALVAEFAADQWLGVDIDTAIAKSATYLGNPATDTGGTHINDRGHALTAATVYAAIQSWAELLTDSEVAHMSRVSKRVTSRQTTLNRYSAATNALTDKGLGVYAPANGSIAAVNLPFTGTGTADYTLDTTWRVLDTTNLVKLISALPGDDIEITLMACVSAAAVNAYFDIAVLQATGMTVIRYLSASPESPTTPAVLGWAAWQQETTNAILPVSGIATTAAQLGDLVTVGSIPGQMRLALVGRVFSGSRQLFGGGIPTSPPIMFKVANVGRTNNGFNTS